jgi:hypothetical protein
VAAGGTTAGGVAAGGVLAVGGVAADGGVAAAGGVTVVATGRGSSLRSLFGALGAAGLNRHQKQLAAGAVCGASMIGGARPPAAALVAVNAAMAAMVRMLRFISFPLFC